jgi:TRAP-type C4-dicarboxylate transport system substrate-binding protein
MGVFQKAVDEEYPGELEFKFKGGPEVVSNMEQIEALRKGVVTMLHGVPSYYGSVMPEMDALGLCNKSPWDLRKVGLTDYLNKLHMKKVNARFLASMGFGLTDTNSFQVHTNKSVRSLAEFKGLKLRCSPTNIPFIKAVGAVPVQMSPHDVFTAMERGVVDGYIIPAFTIRGFGLDKVTKYIILPGIYRGGQSWLFNADYFSKMPQHLQDFLIEKGKEFEHMTAEQNTARIQFELKELEAQGIEMVRFSPEEEAKVQQIAYDAQKNAIMERAPEEIEQILGFCAKAK